MRLIPLLLFVILIGCKGKTKTVAETKTEDRIDKTVYASDITPFFNDWKLILGDGSNAGHSTNFENKDFFYTANDDSEKWIVYKAPNAGDTRGTSNNSRTEFERKKSLNYKSYYLNYAN